MVDEPTVKAAPDVLVQGRIAAMVAGARRQERKPLEARIAARWKEIQGQERPGRAAQVRGDVRLAVHGRPGGPAAAGRAAHERRQGRALIDAERQLGLLRARTQDPELAARAVECLARLNTRKGLLEDAAYYYRVLRDRYPDVKVTADGKTGADLFNEIGDRQAAVGAAWTTRRAWGRPVTSSVKEERDNYNCEPDLQIHPRRRSAAVLPALQPRVAVRQQLAQAGGSDDQRSPLEADRGRRDDVPVHRPGQPEFQPAADIRGAGGHAAGQHAAAAGAELLVHDPGPSGGGAGRQRRRRHRRWCTASRCGGRTCSTRSTARRPAASRSRTSTR